MAEITSITGIIRKDDGTTATFAIDQDGWQQTGEAASWGIALTVEAMRNALIDEDLVPAEWVKPKD